MCKKQEMGAKNSISGSAFTSNKLAERSAEQSLSYLTHH